MIMFSSSQKGYFEGRGESSLLIGYSYHVSIAAPAIELLARASKSAFSFTMWPRAGFIR